MQELMKPIDKQIMMCDDISDILALASIMATTSKNIFVQQLGVDGAKEILTSLLESINNDC
jgi:hypothetical protein